MKKQRMQSNPSHFRPEMNESFILVDGNLIIFDRTPRNDNEFDKKTFFVDVPWSLEVHKSRSPKSGNVKKLVPWKSIPGSMKIKHKTSSTRAAQNERVLKGKVPVCNKTFSQHKNLISEDTLWWSLSTFAHLPMCWEIHSSDDEWFSLRHLDFSIFVHPILAGPEM